MSDRSTIIKLINQALSGSKKISELTEIVSTTNDDWIEIVQSGVNYKIKKSNLVTGVVAAFTDLTDVPNSYSGQAGKLVQVKATEDGLEFVTSGASFTLTDGLGTTANGTAVDLGGNFDANPITIENSANQVFVVVSADPGVQYGTISVDAYSAEVSITNDANTQQNGFFVVNQDSPEISDDFQGLGLKGRTNYAASLTSSDAEYYAQIGYLNLWTGSTNITTLGTIGTGTWNGTRLTSAYTPQGSGLSVWGVTGSSTANQASITGTASQVLQVNAAGTALTFAAPSWWALSGTSTLTGVATITSNTNSQHIFNGTWTATANNQWHFSIGPTITTRASQPSGEVLSALMINPSITAGTGSNTSIMAALTIQPTWNDNGTSGAIHSYIRCYDGTTARFQVTDTNVTIASSSNTLTFTNGVAGPQLTASSGSLQLNGTNVLMQVSGNSWFGVQSSNSTGVSVFPIPTATTSTGTQRSSRNFNLVVTEWTGSASQTNYWTQIATQSQVTNQLSYYDIFFGTTGSAPSLTNLHFRIRNTNGNVYIGAGTSTTVDPTAKLHLGAGTATASTAPLKLTSGTNLTSPEAGVFEYDNTLYFTQSDATRRSVVLAVNATKTTAGAPYTNDGYITVRIGGTDVRLMTTA